MALLECDHVPEPLRAVGDDYGAMFVHRFAEHAPWVRFERIDAVGGDELPSPRDYDAAVITGSRHSVDDPQPWIEQLAAFVRSCDESGLPLVGICFGHQLLADTLGGRVERAGVGWGVGVHEARVLTQQPWMLPEIDRFRLIVSHQDQVVALPDGAELLATSRHAPVAAFQVRNAIGFQGHPEFDAAFASALMASRQGRIPAEVIDVAEASFAIPTDDGAVTSWLGRFLAGG